MEIYISLWINKCFIWNESVSWHVTCQKLGSEERQMIVTVTQIQIIIYNTSRKYLAEMTVWSFVMFTNYYLS